MNSVLFTIYGINIYSQGLMSGFAYLLTLFTLKEIAKKKHLPADFLTKNAVYVFIISLCSARLFFIIFHYDLFAGSPLKCFAINDGGLYLPGALTGGLTALYYITRNKKVISFMEAADIFSCIVPMVLMFGRIGCFMNGCCFGTPSTSFFRIIFPIYSPSFQFYHEFIPLHPVQLYASISDGFLFLFTGAILEHFKYHGMVFGTFLALFSLSNLIFLSFRGDLSEQPKIILFYTCFYILLMVTGLFILKIQYGKFKLWQSR